MEIIATPLLSWFPVDQPFCFLVARRLWLLWTKRPSSPWAPVDATTRPWLGGADAPRKLFACVLMPTRVLVVRLLASLFEEVSDEKAALPASTRVRRP